MKKKTIAELFVKSTLPSEDDTNKQVLGYIKNGELHYLHKQDYYHKVKNISFKLATHGFNHGVHIAIWADTCIEGHFIHLASLISGVVIVPINPTLNTIQVTQLLKHCDAKCLFVDDILRLKNIQASLKESNYDIPIMSFDEFLNAQANNKNTETQNEAEQEQKFQTIIKNVNPRDIATITYTKGNKAAIITHRALTSMLHNMQTTFESHIGPSDKTLMCLPLSHFLGLCDSLLHLVLKHKSIYLESHDKILEAMTIVKPTIMITTPYVIQKIFDKINHNIENQNFIQKDLLNWATAVSKQYYQKIDNDLAPSLTEIIQKNLAYKLIFQKITKVFGEKLRFFISTDVAIASELFDFLRYAGIATLEGYGMAETVSLCLINPISKPQVGTVGLPIGDVQIKFSTEGEILIKTDAMFKGYYKNAELTSNVLTSDGWLGTKDIGKLNDSGYLTVTGRI